MKRKLSTVKPNLPKEYVWKLEIDDMLRVFKCLVTETECILFEADREIDRIPITDSTCLEGVVQVDTRISIYNGEVDFQLERFIPYIRLDERWTMSDTTEEDRLQEQLRLYNRNSVIEAVVGAVLVATPLLKTLITGDLGDWWIMYVFSILFFSSPVLRTFRLKQEVEAIRKTQQAIEERMANQVERIEE